MKNKKFMWHELINEGSQYCEECECDFIGKSADYDENPNYGDECPKCERKAHLKYLVRVKAPVERFISRLEQIGGL